MSRAGSREILLKSCSTWPSAHIVIAQVPSEGMELLAVYGDDHKAVILCRTSDIVDIAGWNRNCGLDGCPPRRAPSIVGRWRRWSIVKRSTTIRPIGFSALASSARRSSRHGHFVRSLARQWELQFSAHPRPNEHRMVGQTSPFCILRVNGFLLQSGHAKDRRGRCPASSSSRSTLSAACLGELPPR
jgi:hypothetical protein